MRRDLFDYFGWLIWPLVVAILVGCVWLGVEDYKDTKARGCYTVVVPVQTKLEFVTTWISTGNGGGYVQIIPVTYTLYQCKDGTTKWR